jgi:small GTP-binding protein
MASKNNDELKNNNPHSETINVEEQNQISDSLSMSESDLISKNFSANPSNRSKDLILNNEIDKEDNEINKEEKDYEVLSDYKGDDFLSFKIIMIGDVAVGKSSLINRAIKKTFKSAYSPTLGFDYFSYYIKINNKVLKLQLWDTGGQEIYQSLVTNFYRNSSFAFMVYAIDNRNSFENIDTWLKEIKYKSNPDIKIFLIGNKCDLTEERKVTYEEGKIYCNNYEFDGFYEVSAKTGERTEEILINAAKVLLREFKDYQTVKSNKNESIIIDGESMKTNRSKNENNNNSKCC